MASRVALLDQRLAACGVRIPRVLLPAAVNDKWPCIACDQYTARREFWDDLDKQVGPTAPSTLRLIYPEVYLADGRDDEIMHAVQARAEQYAAEVLKPVAAAGVAAPLVLVDRTTANFPSRKGVMLCVDLEDYDFAASSQSKIRPTELTIEDRLPPRKKIREAIGVELPHILVLVDDPACEIVEPLFVGAKELYSTDLRGGGGSIKGFVADADSDVFQRSVEALEEIASDAAFRSKYAVGARDWEKKPLIFGVGDGNHSLATAKAIWTARKAARAGELGVAADALPAAWMAAQSCRYALVELQNMHDPGNQFEPIHRTLENCDEAELFCDMKQWLAARGHDVQVLEGKSLVGIPPPRDQSHQVEMVFAGGRRLVTITMCTKVLSVATVQEWLDDYLARNGEGKVLDFVHGRDDVESSVKQLEGCVGLLFPNLTKESFFKTVVHEGVLPRKSFSCGHAEDKRYYLEVRNITRDLAEGEVGV